MFLSSLLFIYFSSASAGFNLLENSLQEFQKAPQINITANKKSTVALLNKVTEEDVKIFIGAEKIRIESQTPDPQLIVFDGKYLWSIQLPTADFPDSSEVTRSKISKKNKQNIFLIDLLGKKFSSSFKIKKTEKKDDQVQFFLEPKRPNQVVQNIQILFEKEKMKSISFEDEVKNKTEILISNIELKKQLSPQLFKYKPDPKIKVIDL